MQRQLVLSGCRWVLGLVMLAGVLCRAETAPPPNILVVLCDDLRPDALGCYGSRHVKTPHIDRLAREGVLFDNAFCTTSLCSPSRASILSGLYAHAHGVTDNFTDYPDALPSFPRQLQTGGYATAYIGKWHMGEDNDKPRPGFDWFVTHKGQGKYFDTAFNQNGQGAKVIKGYYTTVVTDLALDWLGRQSPDQPWCLMLGHKAPHSFYTPEPAYAHTFDQVDIPYPESAFELEGKPDWIRQRLYTWHGIYGPLFDWRKKFPDDRPEAVQDFARMVRGYWGTVLSVDDSMGRLMDWLRRTGQLAHTVVLFMGDNGLLEGEHGMVDKRTAHEPSIRIPMLMRYPKTFPAVKSQRSKALVATVDVAPTLLELAGATPLRDIHGASWNAVVQGKAESNPRQGFFYYYNYEKQFPYTPNVRAVRTQDWKYIRYPHGDGSPDRHPAELYHLKTDPGERTNLGQDPRHADQVARLEVALSAAMQQVGLTPETDRMPLDEGIKSELPDEKIR